MSSKDTKAVCVVALGDSITYGFPFEPESSWVHILSQLSGVEILNKGICGDLTSDMLERFHDDVLRYNPTHVIILGGANDAYWGIEPARVAANLEAMCLAAESNGVEPIIGLPTPVNDEAPELLLTRYRDWMRQFAQEKGYHVIDFYSALLDVLTGGIADGLHVDGAHPSIEGYRRMAETALPALLSLKPRPSHR